MKSKLAETRRARLKELQSRFDSQKDFADASGVVPSHMSQMLSGTRNCGDAVAWRIEDRLKLGRGWLDKQDLGQPTELEEPPAPEMNRRIYLGPGKFDPQALAEELASLLVSQGVTHDDIEISHRLVSPYGLRKFSLRLFGEIYVDVIPESAPSSAADRILVNAFTLRETGVIGKYFVVLAPDPDAGPAAARNATSLNYTLKNLVSGGFVTKVLYTTDTNELLQEFFK